MPSFRRKPIDLVIDVRSRLEFWLGHLDGAICIPVGKLARTLSERKDVTTSSRILVYCASGSRSSAAADILESMGYRNVTDAGAMSAAKADFVA